MFPWEIPLAYVNRGVMWGKKNRSHLKVKSRFFFSMSVTARIDIGYKARGDLSRLRAVVLIHVSGEPARTNCFADDQPTVRKLKFI